MIQITPPKRITRKYLSSVLVQINRANGLPDGDKYEMQEDGSFNTKRGTLVIRSAYGAVGVSSIYEDGGTAQNNVTGLATPRATLNKLTQIIATL